VTIPKLLHSIELLGVADDALKRLGVRSEIVDDDAAMLAEVGGIDPVVRNQVVVVDGRAGVIDGISTVPGGRILADLNPRLEVMLCSRLGAPADLAALLLETQVLLPQPALRSRSAARAVSVSFIVCTFSGGAARSG